jgi:ferredoxin-nitrate reductase
MDRIADIWGTRTPFDRGGQWPVRVDTALAQGLTAAGVDRWVPSACVLCSNGCGCEIAVKDGHMVGIRGRAEDPVNRGRLGPKGLFASWQGVDNGARLTEPLLRRGGRLEPVTWDEALSAIVDRSRRLLEDDGPLSHALLLERTTVPRGVLRPGSHRQGRYWHAPHGRQYPVVHGHRRDGA